MRRRCSLAGHPSAALRRPSRTSILPHLRSSTFIHRSAANINTKRYSYARPLCVGSSSPLLQLRRTPSIDFIQGEGLGAPVLPRIVLGFNFVSCAGALQRQNRDWEFLWSHDSLCSPNTPKPASAIQNASPAAPHNGSWRVPLVTEATKSLSQAAALDWACQITIAESGSESVEKSASQQSKTSLPTPCVAFISRERCLQPHFKQRRISQHQWDRILLSLQHRPDPIRAVHHNREETHTTIKLRQTRRLHQHDGPPGDPVAMAQPRIITIPNKHNIIPRLAAHPLLRR